MRIVKHMCQGDDVNWKTLLQRKNFRIYMDSEIKFATFVCYSDNMHLLVLNEYELHDLEWKNNVLYLYDEPLEFAPDHTIVHTRPIWWSHEINWPPDVRAFSYFKNTNNSHIHVPKQEHNLRCTKIWENVFCESDESLPCICGTHDMSYMYLKQQSSALITEENFVKYRLKGKYNKLFQFNDLFKKKYKQELTKVLQNYYEDQCCIWNKINQLESRNKKVSMTALWLRCVVHKINEHIEMCENMKEYFEYFQSLRTEKSSLILRSGKILI